MTRPLCGWCVLFTKSKDLAVKLREKTTSPSFIAALCVALAAAERGEYVCRYHMSLTVSAPKETYPRGVRDAFRQLVSPINFFPSCNVNQGNRNNRRV